MAAHTESSGTTSTSTSSPTTGTTQRRPHNNLHNNCHNDSTDHHDHHHHSTTGGTRRPPPKFSASIALTQAAQRKQRPHFWHHGQDLLSDEVLYQTARAMVQNVPVKDRKYHLKTFHDCFVGSQAIDFLVDFLQLHSRRDALRVVKEMNAILHICEHVTHDHNDQIQDAHLYYRFTDFCSSRQFTLLEVMRAFQRGIQVADRTYRLVTYPQCFVGTEAVDFLVQYKFAHSRQQAVQLARQLAEKYELFQHVTGQHEFKDEYIFYKMLVPNVDAGMSEKCRKAEEKKALKKWIMVFTAVAIILYYYMF
ncbi:DEP domain-containing mTOR-interacting protein [Seminavis robusta]|uniref:DEP domain-containing mTOR-interacting protein n=1 Tax=Seminavis robusta TaxID=568900 RepID=A0A9N8EPM4_9STRA|nr:DEP domain-containing mTOR-interacting protein [Seminavis robusta]|eukprot:Sro1460_g274590.1 DEP domain-containing mTOR-interacting protein (307) ;mRNA; r:3332-4386